MIVGLQRYYEPCAGLDNALDRIESLISLVGGPTVSTGTILSFFSTFTFDSQSVKLLIFKEHIWRWQTKKNVHYEYLDNIQRFETVAAILRNEFEFCSKWIVVSVK